MLRRRATEELDRAAARGGPSAACWPTCRSARSFPAESTAPLVVALMQAQSDRPVRTFTIGFRAPSYDEATHARAVAAAPAAPITPSSCCRRRRRPRRHPALPEIYDEPFADQSQVPTYLVSRLARRHVTVALSGDGGDESFGGYTRYTHSAAPRRHRPRAARPAGCRQPCRSRRVPPPAYNRAFGASPAQSAVRLSGDRIHKAAEADRDAGRDRDVRPHGVELATAGRCGAGRPRDHPCCSPPTTGSDTGCATSPRG